MPKKKKENREKEENVLEQFEEHLKKDDDDKYTLEDLIPSGLTLLNCGLSDCHSGGYRQGTIVNLVGDSDSGKSLFCITAQACCANEERFDDYELIYRDTEFAFSFDIAHLFGKKTKDRLGKVEPMQFPALLETVQGDIFRLLDAGKSFIYVIDSLDGLKVKEDLERVKNLKEKGEDKSGYHLEKAKKLANFLGSITSGLGETKSLLIITSQTRQNLGFGSHLVPKTKSGGFALTFFSNQEIWFSKDKGKRTVDFNGSKKLIGHDIKVKVKRTRLTGKKRDFSNIPVFYDLGIDDLRANVEWMCNEGFWPISEDFKRPKHYVLHDFDNIVLPIDGAKSGKIDSDFNNIIDFIEKENLEKELAAIVGNKWNEIENAISLNHRKRPFS
jgi:RecA/RadA recombinase